MTLMFYELRIGCESGNAETYQEAFAIMQGRNDGVLA